MQSTCAALLLLALLHRGAAVTGDDTYYSQWTGHLFKHGNMPDLDWGAPVLCDINGDGARDALLGQATALVVLVNEGSDAAPALVPALAPTGLLGLQGQPACADLTGDGLDDVLLGGAGGALSLYVQGADGSFSEGALAVPDLGADWPAFPSLGDLTGDGLPDLVVGVNDSLVVAYNAGNATAPDLTSLVATLAAPDAPARPAVCGGLVIAGAGAADLVLYEVSDTDALVRFVGYQGFKHVDTDEDYPDPSPTCADGLGGSPTGLLLGNSLQGAGWFVNATTVHGPGTAPVAASPAGGALSVSWDAPVFDGGAAITTYIVTCNGSAAAVTGFPAATSLQLESVAAADVAVCEVAAWSAADALTYALASAPVAVAAAAPSAVAVSCASVDSVTATVSWTDANDGGSPLTAYELTLSTAPGDTVTLAASASSYSVTAPGATVTATVTAVSAEGSSAAASCTVTVAAQTVLASLDGELAYDSFPNGAWPPLTQSAAQQPVLHDVDLDGDQDLFMFGPAGSTSFFLNTAAHGDASPQFEGSFAFALLSEFPAMDAGAFGDINADGNADLVFSDGSGSGDVFTAWGSANGSFSVAPADQDPAWAVVGYGSLALADVTGDGVPELFTPHDRDVLMYVLDPATGVYGLGATPAAFDNFAVDVVASFCDADADGDQDALVSQAAVGDGPEVFLSLFLNGGGGGGNFSQAYVNTAASGPVACTPDVNGGGALLNDVVWMAANADNPVAAPSWALRWLSGAGATVPDAVAAAPAVTAQNGSTATLSWDAPASDGGATVTQYSVLVHNDEASQYVVTVTGAPAPTSYTVLSLAAGQTTNFSVVAVNGAGAAAESPVSDNVLPSAGDPDAPLLYGCYGLGNSAVGVLVSVDRQFVNNGGDAAADFTGVGVVVDNTGEPVNALAAPWFQPGVALPPAGSGQSIDLYTQIADDPDEIQNVHAEFQTAYGASSALCEAAALRSTGVEAASGVSSIDFAAPSGGAAFSRPHVVDLTCDGVSDLYFSANNIALYENTGTDASPQWALAAADPLAAIVTSADQQVAFGDLNADGYDDAVVCTPGQLHCEVALNDGACGFSLGGSGAFNATTMPPDFTDVAFFGSSFFVMTPLVPLQFEPQHDDGGAYALVSGWESLLDEALAAGQGYDLVSSALGGWLSFCDITGDGADELFVSVDGGDEGTAVFWNVGNATDPAFSVTEYTPMVPSPSGYTVCAGALGSAGNYQVFVQGDAASASFLDLARVPSPPTGAVASVDSSTGTINVTWTAPEDAGTSAVEGYSVDLTFSSGFEATVAVVDPAATYSYSASNVAAGENLKIEVYASNAAGDSAALTAALLDLPAAPASDDSPSSSDHTVAIVLGCVFAAIAVAAVAVVYHKRFRSRGSAYPRLSQVDGEGYAQLAGAEAGAEL